MSGTVSDSSDCGECLPQRDSGNGIWIFAYAGRCCRTFRKRSRSFLGSRAEKLCGGLHGQSHSLDIGRKSAAGYVFSDYEESEQIREFRMRIKIERTGGRAFWVLSFFLQSNAVRYKKI